MPIGKADVLEVLGDGRLRNIAFSVGPIAVNAREYDKVADYIGSEAIEVVPGKQSLSLYYPQINRLRTRAGDPPLSLNARTNLLHECTHMITDINKCNVTRLTDEVAAYLAQIAYLLLLDSSIPKPPIGPPLNNMMRQCMDLVATYNLGKPDGMGAIISQSDITMIAGLVHLIPDYADIDEREKVAADGVALNGKADEFYRLQLSRFASQALAELDAAAVAQMLTTKVRGVSYENYVTWDPELLELFAAYARGGADQKNAITQKLIRIFLTIDQASATRLTRRLATQQRGDVVSERFHGSFPAAARPALLSALQLSR